MTPSGEQLTLKGEFNESYHNSFSFNKLVAVSYGMNVNNRNKVEITLNNPQHADVDSYQMIFVLKGQLILENKNQSTETIVLGSQQHNFLRFIQRSTRFIIEDVADEVICVSLSPKFLKRYLPSDHPVSKHFSNYVTENTLKLSSVNMHITPEIGSILQRLANVESSTFSDQLLLESKVIELMALQISQYERLLSGEAENELNKEEWERMQEARQILINQVGKKQLSLRELAHLVGTNEYNLKRDFKSVFGNSVYKYLSDYKMEEAKSLILNAKISIAEISKKIGYKHPTHFTSAFKKHFGYLPNKIKSGKLSLLLFLEEFSVLFENIELLFC